MALTKVGKEGITGISNSSNATAITIDASEKVGIGLTSPQELLHLKDGDIAVGNGTASNNAVVGRIGFSTDSSNSRFIGMESFRGSDAANADLRFHTYGGDGNKGERLRIANDGKVGIGETTPTSPLHVKSGAGANIAIQSTAGSHWRLGDAVGASNGEFIIYDYTNSAIRLKISDDGVWYYPSHSTDGGTSPNAIIQSSSGKVERSTASSQKLKENIKDITMDCSKIQNLKVREFDYKSNYVTSTARADIGLIAEEVDAVEPMWTTQGYIDETDCTFKTDEYITENSKTKHAIDIHWRRLQVGMLKEIQRLHTEIETLKTKVTALESA